MKRNLLLKTALALAIASPLMASAESELVLGGGSAAARLDLNVVIPGLLYLGVGSGTEAIANGGNRETIVFDYTTNPEQVGITNSPAAEINTSMATAGSTLPVRVFSNLGQVVITATNPANLVSGSDTIPFTEMSVVSDNTNLPAPGFGGGTSQPVLAGRVTDHTANWTYRYANSTKPAAGSYMGTVTYTASLL
ncbi:MAG: hypothetical protein GTN84_01085 [Hydrogenophaga sp.]|uniref:hypothetical protein n=1 Tax=Hydrogenophaga sp. TaxID=1904254 RepID=UPI00169D7FE1|nr:hypothetical protein [Hydrogenophaga sp.]NIM39746.1 hypothetical protein [Hydrogenophaga sp.]NIN24950.1 hypothetical protein [Hydrogenophaga sp.]NIN29462.1 hypothetical protein [Hydrogenophaga sp.]NIN53985.1 hypothetical protein [Hydrogenophaga sp.]NIO50189.1 hypothetical protein [Hydrogenophaga sp.]